MPRKPISFELDFMIKDIFPRFTVKQFDDVSFNIKPLNQGLDYNTTGMIGKIFVGVNNDMFMQSTGITVSSNNINILLDKNMLQKSGRAYAEIELTDNAGTITSSSFIFDIDPKIGEGGMIPGEYEGFVEKYERLISEFKSQVNSTVNGANSLINSTVSNANSLVNETIKKCNTNIDNKLNTVDGLINTKVLDFEKRFNSLTSKQQQDAEIIDARDGETSLKARLDRDIEKAKEIYTSVEGSNISTDSSSGYLKDVEILGNTIQDIEQKGDLSDIRSVGDKVENQELYEIPVLIRGKNLNSGFELGDLSTSDGTLVTSSTKTRSIEFIKIDILNSYNIHRNGINEGFNVYCYNDAKDFLGLKTKSNGLFVSSDFLEGTKYVKFVKTSTDTTNFQLEEGTVVTPYEPYVEDKLTILSPVQLEKVGDVADRIIEKDGVFGVEKNIEIVVFDGSENWTIKNKILENTTRAGLTFSQCLNSTLMSSQFIYKTDASQYNNDEEGVSINSDKLLCFRILKSKLLEDNINGIKQWLSQNNLLIKYATTQPQFIPLPHSQQVKLRTFANKTNISFLTEIEGTIKAQVPKSIGATVNTHTEQIGNLSKELDRVKKLEESTVSTVTTESDFTTVEATSNGYFEDVKLEGRTLVNRFVNYSITYPNGFGQSINNGYRITGKSGSSLGSLRYEFAFETPMDLSNHTILYTLTWNAERGHRLSFVYEDDSHRHVSANKGIKNLKLCYYCKSEEMKIKALRIYVNNSSESDWTESDYAELTNMMLLEGDHTQNPPSYFEGLASVGQDVEEVSVISNTNILVPGLEYVDLSTSHSYRCDSNLKSLTTATVTNISDKIIQLGLFSRTTEHHYMNIDIQPNTAIELNSYLVDNYIKWITFIKGYWENKLDTTQYYKHLVINGDVDKKQLLYYNPTTQTWEKPILRQWDSIEKHADGKYYYHQRSGELVLDGSEDNCTVVKEFDTTIRYGFYDLSVKPHNNSSTVANIISNSFNSISHFDMVNTDIEGIGVHNLDSQINIKILKSKLSTQDVAGFKAWLQANPVTVVYQLAEEKVYECTNLDLITYADETNYIVNTGAISPKSTLKLSNSIGNVVNLLKNKVSILEDLVQKLIQNK